MSATHVALLRGINVGKARRVSMSDLRAVVEKLGYRGVKTLINSGNVVFAAPGKGGKDHAVRIEKAIEATLGLTSRVTVLMCKRCSRKAARGPTRSRGRCAAPCGRRSS